MIRDWDLETLKYDWRIEGRDDGIYVIESTALTPGHVEYGPLPLLGDVALELIVERKRAVQELAGKYLARLVVP